MQPIRLGDLMISYPLLSDLLAPTPGIYAPGDVDAWMQMFALAERDEPQWARYAYTTMPCGQILVYRRLDPNICSPLDRNGCSGHVSIQGVSETPRNNFSETPCTTSGMCGVCRPQYIGVKP
jgi:hypothetical protein